jgi:hypothetical protein
MKTLIAIVMLFISVNVMANCVYNGVSYPTGTVINGYVCQANGTWGH